MNKRDMMIKRNYVAIQIRLMNRHKNALKFSKSESDPHIQMKLEICKWLKRNNKEFYTEAIFNDGSGRADVINADDEIIYEVYNSEKEKSLLEKSNKYPECFEIIFVDANQLFNEKLIL